MPLAERFEALVDRHRTHHVWVGATDRNGVPQMRVDGRLTTGRRVAWELRHGSLPPDVRVRPCPADPRCVRVDHLTIAERAIPVVRSARVRRPKGAGSAREIRDGVWQLTVTDASGRRTFRTIAGNRDDAERELARMSAQNGQLPTTLDALIAVHLARLEEAGRSESTLRRYEQLWRTWLSPSLGAQARDSVRAVDIESALNAMHEAGQGQRSIHQAAVVLNTAFAWAKRQNITRANPVLRCELPDGTTLITSRGR